MIGSLLVLAINVSNETTGCILAVGGGVYINIAAAECWPRAKESHNTIQDKIISLISFILGIIPIGLVLLNHDHCDA